MFWQVEAINISMIDLRIVFRLYCFFKGNYRDRIRFITVPRTKGVKERTDFEGAKWEVSSPETTMDCSAAGYFFARQLTETLLKHVYFVAETKGNDIEVSQLRRAEDAKIECARRHFAAISTGDVAYSVVKTYQDLYNAVTK